MVFLFLSYFKKSNFFFSVQCLFLSFFLSKADHFRTAVRNLRRRKQITFSTLRHADISSSSEKRKKGLLASQCASSQQIRTRFFFAKIEATFLSGKSGKVRHPNISHKIKNNFKMSSKSIFFTLFNFYCPGYGKNTFKIHGHDHEPENVYPVWQRMRCGTTSLTPFGTTYVLVSYNLDPAIIIPEQTGIASFFTM